MKKKKLLKTKLHVGWQFEHKIPASDRVDRGEDVNDTNRLEPT